MLSFHRLHNLMTKYLTWNRKVRLSRLKDSHNREYQFGYTKVHFSLFLIHWDLLALLHQPCLEKCLRSWLENNYFEISMQDAKLMQSSKPTNSLNQNAPYLTFLEKFFFLFMVYYLLIEVTIVGELHNNAILGVKYQRFLPSRKTSL